MSQLRQEYAQFKQHEAEIVVVTMGTPAQTTQFWQEYQLPFPGLCDPEQQAYQRYTLPDGNPRLLAGPGIVRKTVHGFLTQGFGTPVGSVLQMPGVSIIDQQGIVRYNHPYRSSADNPPNALLLEQLAAMHAEG